eukprot:4102102-Amphidinium_carterae.1
MLNSFRDRMKQLSDDMNDQKIDPVAEVLDAEVMEEMVAVMVIPVAHQVAPRVRLVVTGVLCQ